MLVKVRFVKLDREVKAEVTFTYEGVKEKLTTTVTCQSWTNDYVNQAVKILTNDKRIVMLLKPLVQAFIDKRKELKRSLVQHHTQQEILEAAVRDANARNITFEVEV